MVDRKIQLKNFRFLLDKFALPKYFFCLEKYSYGENSLYEYSLPVSSWSQLLEREAALQKLNTKKALLTTI